jgi:ribosomal protein S18 acetylase RimI-like enzyme
MMNHGEPRRAVPADAEAITTLVREAYSKYIPRMGREPYPMTVNYANAIRDEQMWVVEEDKRIIAVLGLIPEDDHLMIENIAVAAAHQGRGIGRGLLAFAESEAIRQGLYELRLYTAQAMTENISMYSRFGYTETERKTVVDIPRVYMSKPISP